MHDVEAERSRQHPPGPTRSWRVPGLHVAAERSGRLAWRALEWGAVSVVSAALNSSRLLVAASCLLWHEGVLRRRARLPAFCSRSGSSRVFPLEKHECPVCRASGVSWFHVHLA